MRTPGRVHSLLAQIALMLLLPAVGTAAEPARFIVIFDDPPVPLFEGAAGDADPKRAVLRSTSVEATGAKLVADSAAVETYRAYLAERRALVLGLAKRGGVSLDAPLATFDFALNAVVLELQSDAAARLRKQPGIAAVVPDGVARPLTDAGPAWIGAHAFWQAAPAGTSRGEGVVIGVIDSGINASHPSFAGVGPEDGYSHQNPYGASRGLCSGTTTLCNGKLVGVFDFTTGVDSAEPDDGLDPDGHGSHVAATAAGNLIRANVDAGNQTVQRSLSGVAPHANLMSYKACEVEADCFYTWLVAAIDRAIFDGVDVINYSIGGSARSPWSNATPDSIALRSARAAGIVLIVAGGNDGPDQSSISSPGNAPWVLAVANASHPRVVGNRLLDFSGGAAPPPGGGALVGQGNTSAYGPADIIIPTDHPGCGMGSGLGLGADGEPDGSSNPWPGQTNRFNGAIVVCERGTHARLAKSDNVRRAGGGGVVLVNTVGDGESIVPDAHSIPGTHLGYEAAQELKVWLAGGGRRARIEGARLIEADALADRLAASSSRGPVDYGGVLKPDLTAPGTGILAAAGSGNGVVLLSGTSMATPHVAGAAALLRAVRPQWSVSQIESALLTTTVPVVRMQDDVSPASALDQGAGRIAVDAALDAGVYLDVDDADFAAANPATGGSPRALNRAGLQHEACRVRCELSRTVTDMSGGGRWRVEAELPGALVTSTPAAFELVDGASRTLRFQIELTDPATAGQWLTGRVRLIPEQQDVAVAELPLAVFADPGAVPEVLDINASADAGSVDIAFSGLVGLPGARFEAGDLARPISDSAVLRRDPTPDDAFDAPGTGILIQTHVVPAATSGTPRKFVLMAEARSATAADVDLYLGNDYNSDGRPDAVEALCRSTTPGASERCEIGILQSGSDQTVWVLAQNRASGSTGSDRVQLESWLLDSRTDNVGALVASGPGVIGQDAPFAVRLAWDDPGLLPNEERYALLDIHAVDDSAPTATVLVRIATTASIERAQRALVPGQPLTLRLAPDEAQDGLFLDVPGSGGVLNVHIASQPASVLYATRVEPGSGPHVGRAPPRSEASFAYVGGTGSLQLQIEDSAPVAGRWFITPHNAGGDAATVTLEATYEAPAVAQPSFGAWYNPERSGAGVYLYGAGSAWVVVWYTYLEDGTPTWYLGTAPAPAADAGNWSAPVSRHSWDGERDIAVTVGEVVIALESSERMRFAWNLDGSSGSELLQWIGGRGCLAGAEGPEDIGGLWYDPGASGHGLSIEAYGLPEGLLEVAALYLYDGEGRARWVQASGLWQAGQQSYDLLQYLGTCPLCDHQPAQARAIGSLQLDFAAQNTIDVLGLLQFAPPLAGDWLIGNRVVPIAQTLGCPQR